MSTSRPCEAPPFFLTSSTYLWLDRVVRKEGLAGMADLLAILKNSPLPSSYLGISHLRRESHPDLPSIPSIHDVTGLVHHHEFLVETKKFLDALPAVSIGLPVLNQEFDF